MLGEHPAGRGETVQDRHPYVHQAHVGTGTAHLANGGLPVGRLTDHDEFGLALEDADESGADDVLVVDHDHGGHFPSSGSVANTRNPSGTAPASPSRRKFRHALGHRAQSEPGPREQPAARLTVVEHLDLHLARWPTATSPSPRWAPECLRTFVNASWTTRYTASETPSSTGRG